jgi:hypothetical protein
VLVNTRSRIYPALLHHTGWQVFYRDAGDALFGRAAGLSRRGGAEETTKEGKYCRLLTSASGSESLLYGRQILLQEVKAVFQLFMLIPADNGLVEPVEAVVGFVDAEDNIIMDRDNSLAKLPLDRIESPAVFIEALIGFIDTFGVVIDTAGKLGASHVDTPGEVGANRVDTPGEVGANRVDAFISFIQSLAELFPDGVDAAAELFPDGVNMAAELFPDSVNTAAELF